MTQSPLSLVPAGHPPLMLGGNVFGWTIDRERSFAVLDAYYALGGRMIDTADSYSMWVPGHEGGESETIIGDWMAKRGNRAEMIIATKVGHLPGRGGAKLQPARIAAAAAESLARLQTGYIDLYYAHDDDADTPLEHVASAFHRLIEAGQVRMLGASNFPAPRLADALAAAERLGLTSYRAIQFEYNLLSRGFEGPVRDLALSRGLAAFPYYGLAAGFLTGKYAGVSATDTSPRGARLRSYFAAGGSEILQRMRTIAEARGASLTQIALAWLRARPGITMPLASATSAEQLFEIISHGDVELGADDLTLLDAALTEPR